MNREMWTIPMLLEYMLERYNSGDMDDFTLVLNRRAIPILKAFDLYVDEKYLLLFAEDSDEYKEEEANIVGDFAEANFIEKRSENEVVALLNEIIGNEELKAEQEKHPKGNVYFFLRHIFEELFHYRAQLQKIINSYDAKFLSGVWGCKSIFEKSARNIRLEANKIDAILLKIIGDKKPVSKTVLIREYGYKEEYTQEELAIIDKLVSSL